MIRYDRGTLSLTVYHVFPGNLVNYLQLKTELLYVLRGPQKISKTKRKKALYNYLEKTQYINNISGSKYLVITMPVTEVGLTGYVCWLP